MSELCVCCSGKLFINCCDRFLNQNKTAKSPEQLMRSRYSAYGLGGYGEYLLQTWLPSMAQGLSASALSLQTTQWLGLEVINKSQKGDQGFVEFRAFLLDSDKKRNIHHEKSIFQRVSGQWFYASGDVLR